MEFLEQVARIHSDNWADYQKVISFLKQSTGARIRKMAERWWVMEQELSGNFRHENGWTIDSVKAIEGKDGYVLQVTLMRPDGYSIDPAYYNDPDAGLGFGGVPNEYKRPDWKYKTVCVEEEFFKTHKLY